MKKRITIKEFKKHLKERDIHPGLEDSINRFDKYWNDYSEMTSLSEIVISNKESGEDTGFDFSGNEDPVSFFNKTVQDYGIENVEQIYVEGFDEDGALMYILITKHGIEEGYN